MENENDILDISEEIINEVLRYVAASDAAGRLMLSASQVEEAALTGSTIRNQVDLNKFIEETNKSPEKRAALGKELGIQDNEWDTLQLGRFNEAIRAYRESGKADAYKHKIEIIEKAKAIPEGDAKKKMPNALTLGDGMIRRYKTEKADIAIARDGSSYMLYDYNSGDTSRSLTRAEANTLLHELKAAGEVNIPTDGANTPENAEKTPLTNINQENMGVTSENSLNKSANLTVTEPVSKLAEVREKLDAKKIDTYARENITDYDGLSEQNKSMIRKVVREGRALGVADADVLSSARIAARTGVNVEFDSNMKGDDAAYFDPDTNKIVINPKAEKKQELLLIHELDHAVRAYLDDKGTVRYVTYKNADKKLSDETWNHIKKHYADQDIDVSREELLADEASAYYTEAILGGKGAIDLLLGEEPTLQQKILSFFTDAAQTYSKDAQLSKEARKHYRQFKKMFNAFAEVNKGMNAFTAVDNGKLTVESGKSERTSKDVEAKLAEYKKPITLTDVQPLRALANKSINSFSSAQIDVTGKWAHKFYLELGVKSPYFRAWFGDWRAYDNTKQKIVTVPTIDISQAQIKSGNYTIKDTGWDVYAGKILNDDTRHHTGGQRVNVKSLNTIDLILENAVLLDTVVSEPDTNKKSANTAFLHKLYTLIEYGGKMYIAKTTVEEFYNETANNIARRAYNLKAIKIEPAGGQLGINSSSSVPVADSTYSISDLFEFVKTYDKEFRPKPVNPLLLNEDGTPKTVYHGTNTEFWTFEKGHKRTRGRLNFGQGFYFAASKSMAENYVENSNGKIIEAYINIRKPYEVIGNSFTEFEMDDIRSKLSPEDRAKLSYDNVNDYLAKLGYDGVIGYNYSGTQKSIAQIVAFKSEQIKSATDNIGTFDSQSKDIRRSTNFEATLADEGHIESVAGRDAKAGAKRASRFSKRATDMTVGQLRQMVARYTGEKVYSSKEARETIDEIYGVFSLSGKNRAKLYEAMWQGYNTCRTDNERAEFSFDMAEYVTVLDARAEACYNNRCKGAA